jgi:hypothetical protein
MKTRRDGRASVMVSATTAGIINGEVDLSIWDHEELLRGQRKNKRGTWTGRPPVLVPAALHKQLTKRRLQRATALLADSLVDAVLLLRAVINDKRASKLDRIKAAEIVIDRVMGKAKESVQVEMAPWQGMVATSIVGTAEQARALMDGITCPGTFS